MSDLIAALAFLLGNIARQQLHSQMVFKHGQISLLELVYKTSAYFLLFPLSKGFTTPIVSSTYSNSLDPPMR